MINIKLEIPCTYQGGKQRIASDIVDVLLQNNINDDTKFYDLCCGSGAVSIELVNRGISPKNIIMLDKSPWGMFWKMVGSNTFDFNRFKSIVNNIPIDPTKIKDHIVKVYKEDASIDTVYKFLILQSASFGGKAIWLKNKNEWCTSSFRGYWLPTETSNRRSPVNPMMPMPKTLLNRVNVIGERMSECTGIYDDISSIKIFENNSIVYIDPPYDNTSGYGHSFDVYQYVVSNNIRCFVSEGKEISAKSILLSSGRLKGGISGDRTKKPNEEWLNIFE